MNWGLLHGPRRSRATQGFSLLEVLIASTILALVVALLLGVTNGASSLWLHAERHREASREVRAGLGMIMEDLHSAVLTEVPETLMIQESKTDPADQKLFFLVSHSNDQRHEGIKGDLCATGYFIASDPRSKGGRNLYRFHASGDDVEEAYTEGKLAALYASASPENKNTELLARNITGFGIHPIRVAGVKPHPDALRLTLSTVNGDTSRIIDSKPGDSGHKERLLRQNELQLSTVVCLPPQRDMPQDHE